MKKYILSICSLILIGFVIVAEFCLPKAESGLFSSNSEVIETKSEANPSDSVKNVKLSYDPLVEFKEISQGFSSEYLDKMYASYGKMAIGDAHSSFATVLSCEVVPKLWYIKLAYSMPGIPESDDEYLYLFELPTYCSTHEGDFIAKVKKQERGAFLFSYSKNRLFDKYVMAVKQNNQYIDISSGNYITNPEVVAKYTYDYPTPASKKGLIVDNFKVANGSLTDLGVKQAAYNIPIGYVLGQTSSANHPTIYYNYNGKTYAINGQRIAEFDIVFKALTNQGIVTTAVLLNNPGPYSETIHPNAKGGNCPYYMFNAANEEGVQALEAVATFLAERYSGTEHGQIVNWVVGNEINARSAWNYYNYTDVNSYSEEYAKGFRIFYTAIKSVNANARVYMCLDQQWDRNTKNTDSYDAKDVLDSFNNSIISHGNIDYGVAHHPYPVPLTWPKFWDMPANYKRMNLVKFDVSTPFITIQNIHILTDYLSQGQFLTNDGEVRSVLINEIGFGSDNGETLQAACFAYGYYIAEANQHIDGFILNKQTDHPVELAQGLALGLDYSGGGHKYIYNVFKNIDGPNSKDVTDFAKGIIGISDWSEVISAH